MSLLITIIRMVGWKRVDSFLSVFSSILRKKEQEFLEKLANAINRHESAIPLLVETFAEHKEEADKILEILSPLLDSLTSESNRQFLFGKINVKADDDATVISTQGKTMIFNSSQVEIEHEKGEIEKIIEFLKNYGNYRTSKKLK